MRLPVIPLPLPFTILPVSPSPLMTTPLHLFSTLLVAGCEGPLSDRLPRTQNYVSIALLLTLSLRPLSLFPFVKRFPSLFLPPPLPTLVPFPLFTQELALKQSTRKRSPIVWQKRRMAALEMNMHAESKKNRCLLSKRVDPRGSITDGFFVFHCSRYPLVGQALFLVFFFISYYMFWICFWPVSHLWAVQLLRVTGSVSHLGRPRLLKNRTANQPRLAGFHSSSLGSFVSVSS